MITQILLLTLGFGVLIKGADWLVAGGSALARKYNVSELAIGLTIVAFGTSMPELIVNVFAAYQGQSEIVIGNIIGSNNFNLFAILGIAGLITPLVVQSSTVWKEIPLSFFAAVLFFILGNSFFFDNATVTRIDGILLLVVFCFFLFYVYKQMKSENLQTEIVQDEFSKLKIFIYISFGLALLVAGGRLVVVNSVSIAETLGISQAIIGLTIVAIGTSLPELATSVVAALKKKNDIAMGNIVGSNIFNILFILGISAVIKPIEFSTKFNTDLYLLGIGTFLLFLAMLLGQKKKLDRWEAGILLLMYIMYTIYLIQQ